MDPKKIYLAQILLGVIFILAIYLFRRRPTESGFRVREADLKKNRKTGTADPRGNKSQDLANAKMRRHEPLRLMGISLDGAPHEILGVREDASAEDIQRAYRELMKRYHPDRVGRQDSREWADAQKIAHAVNAAKEQLLKGRRK